jgi:hypothetical protein
MATQVQRRGGSTSEHNTFTGAARELTIDTTKQTVVVHDGSTVGGHPLQKQFPPVGSAAAPTYTFTGDTNTGIYSPGADQVAISTNGTGRLFVDSSGNVGVGVSPSASLEVNGESRFTRSGASTQYVGIIADGTDTRIVAEGSSKNLLIKNNSTTSSAIFFDQAVASVYVFQQAGSERLRITSAGLVGVGTSSVTHALTVTTAGTDAVKINTADYGYLDLSNGTSIVRLQNVANVPRIGTATNHPLGFAVNEIERMRLTSTGLGIGTTSPSAATHVVQPSSGSDTFRAENSASNNVIRLQAATSTDNYIDFYAGASSGSLILRGAGTERARIDSSGRLLVGTSTAGNGGTLSVNGTSSVGGGSTGAQSSMSKVGMERTSSVTTSAKTIFTGTIQGLSSAAAAHIIVYGNNDAGAGFLDVVAAKSGGTVAVISSSTIEGSPAARTYTMSSDNLQLQMASGTYNTNVRCTSMGYPF